MAPRAATHQREQGGADRVPARTFAGLLGVISTDAEAVREVCAVGYDPLAPDEDYGLETWREAVDIALARKFGHLDPSEGMRALGREFVSGFLRTPVGAAVGAGLSDLAPERAITRLPRFINLGRPGLEVSVLPEPGGLWRMQFREVPDPSPDFSAGVVEASLRLTGARPEVTVENSGATGYDLLVRL
ncbi:MAG: DUF2378 family protein [Myxococcales bacterium]|nr:DUF2378 family protein [Myxococcales bacterium]